MGLKVVGRKATVHFTEWPELTPVVAKIDTGAYSGALHVLDIREGKKHVYFRPFSADNQLVRTSHYHKKRIRSR